MALSNFGFGGAQHAECLVLHLLTQHPQHAAGAVGQPMNARKRLSHACCMPCRIQHPGPADGRRAQLRAAPAAAAAGAADERGLPRRPIGAPAHGQPHQGRPAGSDRGHSGVPRCRSPMHQYSDIVLQAVSQILSRPCFWGMLKPLDVYALVFSYTSSSQQSGSLDAVRMVTALQTALSGVKARTNGL